MMEKIDVLVIGGGPAGMAAALGAQEAGAGSVLILERDHALGGILQQCIHNGFGLHRFKTELTGPEYARLDLERLHAAGIQYRCDTMVLTIQHDHTVETISPVDGCRTIQANSIVLAMGCRERPRGAIGIPGTRCSGIMTAGTAQRLVNLEGLMPGRRIVILGSGDIGLIMARRLTCEGARVFACVELMPFSSGLKRNVVQCLDDYQIPLFLSHTVVDIEGRERLEAVTIARVDRDLKPVPGTEQRIACDTLLLSVGLIPENELSRQIQVELSPVTGGPVVDQHLQTSVDGIFSCGNVLHVHDLVDDVSAESMEAGRQAALYARNSLSGQKRTEAIRILDGSGARGVVPQLLRRPEADQAESAVRISFQPASVFQPAVISVSWQGKPLLVQRRKILTPGEMCSFTLPAKAVAAVLSDGYGDLVVSAGHDRAGSGEGAVTHAG